MGWIRLAALLAAATAVAGCIQMEQSTTLLPDGSGKVVITFGMKKSTLDMLRSLAKQFGGEESPDPLKQFTDPKELEKNSEGIVAWAKPERSAEGDWERVKLVGYFEEANKVKIYTTNNSPQAAGERQLQLAFDYTPKDGGGGTLIVTNGSQQQAPGGGDQPPQDMPEEMRKGMVEMMKPMIAGLKIAVSVTVPGAIEEATGFTSKSDRTATFSMTADDAVAAMDPDSDAAKKFKELREQAERDKGAKITWATSSVTDEDKAAFKKELEAAKEAWKKLLEEQK